MLSLRRRRDRAELQWQVWTLNGDHWSTIGAPRSDLREAARLARIVSAGRNVAVLPLRSRPIRSD